MFGDLLQVRSKCKKFVTGVRRQPAKEESVATWQDSTEVLKIEHQKEVQSMILGTISLCQLKAVLVTPPALPCLMTCSKQLPQLPTV